MFALEHPDITRALRTGYPNWESDEYEDDESNEDAPFVPFAVYDPD